MTSFYLVGGTIRDLLLGRAVQDLDFAFSGDTASFVQTLPEARKVGRSVDVWLLDHMEFRPLQGTKIEEDLRARDLSINAMALDENGRLHLHPQAVNDLRDRILRPAGEESFARDPLRVFRVARLAAQLPEFDLHPDTLRQMRRTASAGLLAPIPPERVSRELRKSLEAPRPSRFLRTLLAGQCLSPWFRELEGAQSIPAGPPPWHDNSVLEHICETMDQTAGNPLAVWMALCHDLGKTGTAPEMLPHHYDHEERGAQAAQNLAERLHLPKRFLRAGTLSSRLHMKGGRYAELRPGTRRDLLWQLHQERLHRQFWTLAEADSGKPLREKADADLAALLEVRLPQAWENQGERSGRMLRDLQCQALSRRRAFG